MKHVTFADKSLLVDDETADAVIEYAALLAHRGQADAVEIHAFSSDGQEVQATLLLDAGAPLMAETTNTSLPDPDNRGALAYIRERIIGITSPDTVRTATDTAPNGNEDFDL